MKEIIFSLCFLLFAGIANATVLDAPHNETHNIGCNSCHNYSLWWEYSPVKMSPAPKEHHIIVTTLCEKCHFEGAAIPWQVDHSHLGVGDEHRTELGDWITACTDCHNPHHQEQLTWNTLVPQELYLVTGEIDFDSIVHSGNETTFDYVNISQGLDSYWDSENTTMWADDPQRWSQKTGEIGRGLIMAIPTLDPAYSFKVASVDDVGGTITVKGLIDSSYDDDQVTLTQFGLVYGQLIRDTVNGNAVKFFNPALHFDSGSQGGFVYQDSVTSEQTGLCVSCHERTEFWTSDNLCRDGGGTIIDCPCRDQYRLVEPCVCEDVSQNPIDCYDGNGNLIFDPINKFLPNMHETLSPCTDCHNHKRGFGDGTDKWKHTDHKIAGVVCADCHGSNEAPILKDNQTFENTTVCDPCHNNGVYDTVGHTSGPPNKTDFKAAWENEGGAYDNYIFGCFGCHDGWPDYLNQAEFNLLTCDPAIGCDQCHTGKDPDYNANPPCLHNPVTDVCIDCHDGPGPGSQDNYHEKAVGMTNQGHETLVSTKWIRQYPCWYCHNASFEEDKYNETKGDWNMTDAHMNGKVDVVIDPFYEIVGLNPPEFKNGNCTDLYCHSDGTTLVDPGDVRPYTWHEGRQACNSCHGHDPSLTTCSTSECHDDGRTADYWDTVIPEKKWLSAMPMYDNNVQPGQEGANSHYRHLFTGFSCADCHADTIDPGDCVGPECDGGCLDCHETGDELLGEMTETSHIIPENHVNRIKDVKFRDDIGFYDKDTKKCSGTVCHTGDDPQWGGSVTDAIVCRQCHLSNNGDFDDFGKFNNKRAKIDYDQWYSSGHGRKAIDGPYPSGNPAADFPENGCWYCHDSNVLHQDEERPFRLIQHDLFKNRFEKECVFCHMIGDDTECFGCHNDPAGSSLALQLVTIGSDSTIFPGYDSPRPDHVPYANELTSCASTGISGFTCHLDDTLRHNTGTGPWNTQEEKDDVKNAYLQMGVCLRCHDVEPADDIEDGRCHACHEPDLLKNPPDSPDKYLLGFDPPTPETDHIRPVQARASSFHFGYKHYNAYRDSLGTVMEAGSATAGSSRTLTQSGKTWDEDIFVGRRLEVTLVGSGSTETRPIVRNDGNTITVAPPFSSPAQNGDSYTVYDVVWKGGKFCWDCHDPHGDDNIYMIQNEVATRTDGIVGKPITRAAVSFTRKQTGTDYARIDPPFNGICNVCHSPDPLVKQHYTSANGDNHNSGRICTECHEHRFTDSHASGAACDSCHGNRPVPRHTGFGQARDCTKCHADAINNRMNIMMQFIDGNSHHVQGVTVENKHCYACHWESTPEGIINRDHHQGYNNKTHQSDSGAQVDLVIWGPAERPTVYDDDGLNGDDTAVAFTASDINTTLQDGSLLKQRQAVSKVTKHCLGCHSDQNNDTIPFEDCKTPRQYAWDRSSVASRYSSLETTSWGKYSNINAAKKGLTKAFSAHGNAVSNQGGYDDDPSDGNLDGEDGKSADGIIPEPEIGSLPNSRDGGYNIQCFDCHSSHGSKVGGVTSSYMTFNGTRNGANLKETQKDKGGYTENYMATANTDTAAVNFYQAGAGQCFDCHENAVVGTYLNAMSKTPWGYNETFEATSPIMGYRDTPKFGQGSRGLTDRFSFKQSTIAGGHFNASSDLGTPAMGTIDGLCTPCHDPHGVSDSLGENKQYAVPLLKGTWMSSPYKDDAPAMDDDGRNGENYYNNYHVDWNFGTNFPRPPQQRSDGRGPGAWRTDRNTFNQEDLSNKTSHPVQYDRVDEEPETFAGLCLRCHPKGSLTTEVSAEATENVAWLSKDRIHRSVKGWGWDEGETPREHSFTCSKCHSPHASGLPRLMKTNCLNYSHRAMQPFGGMPGMPWTTSTGEFNFGGKFPYGWWAKGEYEKDSTATCHGADTANGPENWPDNQRWNIVTPWSGGGQ